MRLRPFFWLRHRSRLLDFSGVISIGLVSVVVWKAQLTWIVLVPVLLRPLQELQVVLHLALDEHFHRNGAVDVMSTECIWWV